MGTGSSSYILQDWKCPAGWFISHGGGLWREHSNQRDRATWCLPRILDPLRTSHSPSLIELNTFGVSQGAGTDKVKKNKYLRHGIARILGSCQYHVFIYNYGLMIMSINVSLSNRICGSFRKDSKVVAFQRRPSGWCWTYRIGARAVLQGFNFSVITSSNLPSTLHTLCSTDSGSRFNKQCWTSE